MAAPNTEQVRNIVLVGQDGSGKTSLAEAMLYVSGKTPRMGTTHDGKSYLDYDEEEIKRRFTISAAVAPVPYKDFKINVIDTSGHPDFIGDTKSCMQAAEMAMFVVDAVDGPLAMTSRLWREAEDMRLSRSIFINHIDREGADFTLAMAHLHARFGSRVMPLTIPMGNGEDFKGVIDVIRMKARIHENGVKKDIEIPAEYMDSATEGREKLCDLIAEADDELMMKYLDGDELTIDEIRYGIRKATIDNKMTPVLCGTSYRNKGVQPLLDAIVDYLPSPLDIPPVKGTKPGTDEELERRADDNEPFSALVFKIMADPYVGKLAFFRVYSGTLSSGSYVYNSNKSKRERVGRILRMHANHREEIDEIRAGDIASAVGLKETTTGNTICDENNPIVLESMEFPEPVIRVAIEPKTKAGQDKMSLALIRLAEEDPTFKTYSDETTGQTIIAGMGELHLEIIVDRLLREFRVEATVGKPQVAYKECIRKRAKAEGRYVRQTGGHGQFGHCVIEIYPREPGSGYEFNNKIVGGVIPKEFIAPIDQGIREAALSGIVGGHEVVDFGVDLIDGSYHEVDSSEMAFKIAGSMAFKEALLKANCALLEPMMKVEVVVPDEYMGDVMGDISSRRGRVTGMDAHAGMHSIDGIVPLSEMFGYATDLRSKTQGRGTYTMQFAHYEEVPASIADKILGRK